MFGDRKEVRSGLTQLVCASVALVVGITPQSYVWLDTNGTLISGALLIPEFQPANPLTGQGIIFVFNLILLLVSITLVAYDWMIAD
jgi:hypothetical protein